jgi:AraC-like DNA-binding protein
LKPLLQKLPLDDSTSFVAQTFRTPHFEVGWHQHIEYELILFTEGSGLSFVGNHVGAFETGDIYFLGSHLPHTFQKSEQQSVAGAIVIQFTQNFWGNDFLRLPECRLINQLLGTSHVGLKITGQTRQQLQPLITALQSAGSLRRILLLGECLETMAKNGEYIQLSNHDIKPPDHRDAAFIERVFQYTIDNFKEHISLSDIAAHAHMSVPAFCTSFKRSTKKTYIHFLNEVRIGYACKLLVETSQPVLDICFASGFNTVANFHKQFSRMKNMTPLGYRKLVV